MDKKYVTYILWSDTAEEYYVGQTDNFVDRFQRHNSGRSLSTRHGVPWKLVWRHESSNRAEAIKLERRIKGRGAKRFLAENFNG